MKFMRLGSKPDNFTTRGNITSVVSDLQSDISLDVDGRKFHLHKFPLLAKCGSLHKLLTTAHESSDEEVKVIDFPGSAPCFEMCAKFCYGITVTLNAHNVGEVRCGAEYLDMSETVDKSNLIFKLEVFLNSSILRGWRDSITCLQSSKEHLPWSEDLKIIGRCIESVSSKAVVDTLKVDWSFSYTRPSTIIDHVSVSQPASPAAAWNGMHGLPWLSPVPRDWWVEDICELDMDLYWRVMVAIKAKGAGHEVVGEAIRVYALRWLPGVKEEHSMQDGGGRGTRLAIDYAQTATKHKQMLETIVGLLPSEKGSSSCTFLLKLLKAATILNTAPASKIELARRIGLQLEEANLRDLLIPSLSYTTESLYDVDLVMRIVENYLLQNQSPPLTPVDRSQASPRFDRRRTRSAENIDFSESRRSTAMTHGSKLKVAKLIDSYLAEIARDPNLALGKFLQLAESIPDFARPSHDGLYRAVDMYLKEHPAITKGDRKKLCRLLDCRKLSMDACMHAAQNERLPLRTVVQVLFFEQVRTAASGGFFISDMPSSIRALLAPESGDDVSLPDGNSDVVPSLGTGGEGWDSLHQDFSSLKGDLDSLKHRIAEAEKERNSLQTNSLKPPKPRSMFSSFKPKKFFQKLFFSNKKVSSSASSRDSETQSSMPISGISGVSGKVSSRPTRRHSIT